MVLLAYRKMADDLLKEMFMNPDVYKLLKEPTKKVKMFIPSWEDDRKFTDQEGDVDQNMLRVAEIESHYIIGCDPYNENTKQSSSIIVFQRNGGNFIDLSKGSTSYLNEAGLKDFDQAVQDFNLKNKTNLLRS